MAGYTPHPIVAQLRRLRLDQNIAQKDLAETLGVGDSAMSTYESGQVARIQLDMVDKWADLLNHELVLVAKTKKARSKAGAPPAEDDASAVYLSKYQVALAMGMLISAAHNTNSEKLSKELVAIADVLADALS